MAGSRMYNTFKREFQSIFLCIMPLNSRWFVFETRYFYAEGLLLSQKSFVYIHIHARRLRYTIYMQMKFELYLCSTWINSLSTVSYCITFVIACHELLNSILDGCLSSKLYIKVQCVLFQYLDLIRRLSCFWMMNSCYV